MNIQKENLKDIADAIREKEGSTEPIVANTFPERIRAISTGLSEEEADERYVQKEPKEASQAIKGQLAILSKSGDSSVQIYPPYIALSDHIAKITTLANDTLLFENWDDDEEKIYNIAITPNSRKTEDADAETGLFSAPMIELGDQYGYGSGVILSGVKEPTADYDAANKKYVDGKFLPLAGGGRIEGDGTIISLKTGEGGISVYDPTSSKMSVIAPGSMGVMDESGSYGALIEIGEKGLSLVDTINNGPISLYHLKDPERDDAAATKQYVDKLGENMVKKKGATLQNIDGSIALIPAPGLGGCSLDISGKGETESAPLTDFQAFSHGLNFSRHSLDGIGDGDYDFSISSKAREVIEGTGATVPTLEFSDGMMGYPGIILSGVNEPTQDYDAANKKYVDSGFLRLGGGSLSNGYSKVNIFSPEEELFANPLEVWTGYSGGNKDMVSLGYTTIMFHRIIASKKYWSVIDGSNDGFIQVYKMDENGNDTPIIIRGVDTPEKDTDATNKKYVDEAIAAAVGDISAVLDAINGEVV